MGSSLLLALAVMQFSAPPASAAPPALVSLTFDGGSISQYNLGYLQALQPHGAKARSSSTPARWATSANFMTWTQLATLDSAGNDIGGKTVNATNLTTDPNPSAQVCNDRAATTAARL